MSNFPHSRLFLGTHRTVVISGPHIQVLDSNTGDALHSTGNFDPHAKDAILKSGHVRCAAIDASDAYLATSGDDKILKVWQLDGLKLLSVREPPKKPTGIQFTRDGQTLLVSDKFGDIFSYPLHWTPDPSQPEKSKRDALTSHENTSGGTLILGHASLLTSFVLSADERYVISADRDEHVRVSWYPQGWNVEMFCLGHQKYVSSIHLPAFAPQTLISGGGDPTLKLWDWMNGKVKAEVQIQDIVQGFIKVRAAKKGRVEQDGGDKRKRKMGRGKEKETDQGDEEDMDGEDGHESPGSNDVQSVGEQTHSADDFGALVQVIHKIDSFEIGTRPYLLFSAVGATAIFYSPFPLDTISPPSSDVRVRYFDFGRPVLDFVSRSGGLVWVLLDGEWDGAVERGRMVQVIRWDSSADEFKPIEESSESALLASLNSTCLLPASPTELKSLDLYASLLSMPKNSADDPDGAGDGTPQDGKNKNKGQAPVTKRQLGRLKNKMALARVVESSLGTSGGAGSSKDEEQEGQREHKRTKSEIGGGAEYGDVAMDES